jgi:ABC-type transport system involved in multi-copper enzyme maturation permease subunit
LILGFDTIDREKNEGTLSKLLSQPIYRDAVINGKFLAGVALITIMMVSIVLVITGLGLIILGTLTSPMELYTDATATIIDPMRKSARSMVSMGPMESLSISRFSGPLSLSQSVLIVVPYIISLVAITIVCFAVSYTVVMRQEIRSL